MLGCPKFKPRLRRIQTNLKPDKGFTLEKSWHAEGGHLLPGIEGDLQGTLWERGGGCHLLFSLSTDMMMSRWCSTLADPGHSACCWAFCYIWNAVLSVQAKRASLYSDSSASLAPLTSSDSWCRSPSFFFFFSPLLPLPTRQILGYW